MIVAEHLAKTFEDGTVAVRDVTFEVAPGETLAMLGSNGAGKTTAVHMILGNIPPTSGRSLVHGVCMQDDPLEAKKHLAYVSENVLLYGALTAEQNLRFFARICGKPGAQERIPQALDRVGLSDAARRRAETFSKGMRQRLGIAVALVKDAGALVLDEPTTGLDPIGVRELDDVLIALREEGKAILLVTHDLLRLHEIADRITVIRDRESTPPVRASSFEEVQALYVRALAGGEVLHA